MADNIDQTQQLCDQRLIHINRFLAELEEIIMTIPTGSRESPGFYRACLFASICELCNDSVYLFECGRVSGLPVLIRAIAEAQIDLFNLCDSDDYLIWMKATFWDERRRVLENANPDKSNPYFDLFAQKVDFESELQYTKRQLREFKAAGYRPLRIREKFERAGRLHEYSSVYGLLSRHTHNVMSVLEARHIDEGGVITIYRQPSANNNLIWLTAIGDMIFPSVLVMLEKVDSDHLNRARSLNEAYRALGVA